MPYKNIVKRVTSGFRKSIATAFVLVTVGVPNVTLAEQNLLQGDRLSQRIAAGDQHTLALAPDGSVWAWGDNRCGQRGYKTPRKTNRYETQRPEPPNRVDGLPPVIAVAAGKCFSYAVAKDGTVWAWGDSRNGWFEDHQTATHGSSKKEAQREALQRNMAAFIKAIDSGNRQEAERLAQERKAIEAGADIKATVEQHRPKMVPNITDVVAIQVSNDYGDHQTYNIIALKRDGTVWLWGSDIFEQQAMGPQHKPLPLPIMVSGLSNVVQISKGFGRAIALKGDGSVWGFRYGGIGLPNPWIKDKKITATRIEGLSRITALVDKAAGAIDQDGKLYAISETFSENRPSQWHVIEPHNVDGWKNMSVPPVSQMMNGENAEEWIVLTKEGTVMIETSPRVREYMDVFVQLPDLRDIRSIAAGVHFYVAVKDDGTVWTWGINDVSHLNGKNAHTVWRQGPRKIEHIPLMQ